MCRLSVPCLRRLSVVARGRSRAMRAGVKRVIHACGLVEEPRYFCTFAWEINAVLCNEHYLGEYICAHTLSEEPVQRNDE